MSDDIRFERLVAAGPERVFTLFTSPGGQREFYGRDEPGWIVESRCDLRVGGVWSITFGPSPDELYHHRHIFEVIERPRRLRLASTETRADGFGFGFTTEFTFEPRGNRTLMTMTQTGFPNELLRQEHTIGVPHAYDRIERLLQPESPPSSPARASALPFRDREMETP